jgi:hypothetical protein
MSRTRRSVLPAIRSIFRSGCSAEPGPTHLGCKTWAPALQRTTPQERRAALRPGHDEGPLTQLEAVRRESRKLVSSSICRLVPGEHVNQALRCVGAEAQFENPLRLRGGGRAAGKHVLFISRGCWFNVSGVGGDGVAELGATERDMNTSLERVAIKADCTRNGGCNFRILQG